MTKPYGGSCLCGVVKFEVDEFLSEVGHCHCSMCRKFHGAAFATIAGVSRSHFRWIEGEEALAGYTAKNGTKSVKSELANQQVRTRSELADGDS